jgi:ribosomal protein L37AE/L43A
MRPTGPLLALCFLTACATRTPGPAPSRPISPQAPSNITLTVIFPLSDLEATVQREVPKRVAKTDGYEVEPDGRFGMQYVVERDPIRLGMRGDTIRTAIRFRYAIRACHRTPAGRGRVAMWPCASCGFGEPMREAVVLLDSKLQWDRGLFIRSATTAGAVEFYDRCRVTGLRVDVTDWRVRPFIEAQVRNAASQIDARVRQSSSVARELAAIWSSLQVPVEVAPRSWFVLAPQALRFGAIRGDATAARTVVTMVASPRVVIGERPGTARLPMPQPLLAAEGDPALHVPFAIELTFPEAAALIEQHLKTSFTMTSADRGQIVLTSDRWRITGTPHVDPATKILSLPDLEYEVRGARSFADRLRHGATRARLRSGASLDLAADFERFRSGLEAALRLKGIDGRIASIDPIAIETRTDRFVIHAVASGTATLSLRIR